MTSIIKITNATVFRGTNKVFSNLNLEFKLGENVAILGPNGAGKTTLLKLITREISPVVKNDSEILLFGDRRTVIWEHRKKIGIVSHEYQNDYRALATGLDVVISGYFGTVGIHGHDTVTQNHIDNASKLMESLEITHLKHQQYLQLSTGQQRRLLLARALIHQPQVLIFDEPTAGLDLQASFQLIEEMRRLSKAGITLILVTHHTQELIPEIKRIVMLKEGKVFKDLEKSLAMTDENLSALYGTPVSVKEHEGFYQAIPACN